MGVAVEEAISNETRDLFTSPNNKICKLTGIQVANTDAATRIEIQDTFTTTTSNGASATSVTEVRKVIMLEAGKTYSWNDDEGNIKIFGTCKVEVPNVTAIDVTVMWE